MKKLILCIFTLLLCFDINAKGEQRNLEITDDYIKIVCNGKQYDFVLANVIDHLFTSGYVTIGNSPNIKDLACYDATKNPQRTLVMLPSNDVTLQYGYSTTPHPVVTEKHKNFVKQYLQSNGVELVGFIKKDNEMINFYLKLPQKINGKRVRIGIVASQKQVSTGAKTTQRAVLKEERPIYMIIERNEFGGIRTVHPIESLPE